MAPSKSIKYMQLDPSEYSQRTLGQMNGFVIETDQIQLRPLHLERDAPRLWEVYKNHPELFDYMPHGPFSLYQDFYNGQAKFCKAPDFFNWTVYVSAHPSAPSSSVITPEEKEEKQWVLCGSICLLDIVLPFRRFEVGSIWFHPSVHGSFVMVETTYALLRFCFEKLQAGRVQWKTHHKNIASQKAARKLGFREEGTFKKHMIHADGTWRHTLFYAMTDDDWFGTEEETVEGKAGLVVVSGVEVGVETGGVVVGEARGLQRQLEDVVEGRKREGKPLTKGIARGEPLV
ncbi:hypothetical protein BGX29_006173 [Mortierella sp. GBA35]|nr:hypothetical protein BGX23_000359 [Mortierella sp. AD031]KAF9107485.1 hypothetical protein BGX29_006173 [Mortierella sp. GBA35]KAG0218418.1 hypothetical protein BGX33_007380 [Mortierella sp. NVP41]